MVSDLLREIVGERWVERIDFSSAKRVSASFVSWDHQGRESDVIWKFRTRDGQAPVYVYILMEFQSRPDRYMPVRLMAYEGLLYQTLIAGSDLSPQGRLPLVIPIVLYNGREPVLPRLKMSPEGLPATLTLEEFETMLAENIEEWNRKLREESLEQGVKLGFQQGIQQGVQQGEARTLLRQLRLKFGPLTPETEERVRSAAPDILDRWSDRILTAESLESVFSD